MAAKIGYFNEILSQLKEIEENHIVPLRSKLCYEIREKIKSRIAELLIEAEKEYPTKNKPIGIIMSNGTWVIKTQVRTSSISNIEYTLPQHKELDALCGLLSYEKGLIPFDMTLDEAKNILT